MMDETSPIKVAQYFTQLPDKRLLAEKLQRAIAIAKEQGRMGVVLTCKGRLIRYYEKFGFVNEGLTAKSTHGGAEWYQMRLTFED